MQTWPLDVTVPASAAPLRITAAGLELRSTWAPPATAPAAPSAGSWSHRDRRVRRRVLAGIEGQVVADTFEAGGLEMTRQVWMSRQGDAAAVRLALCNRQGVPLCLEALVPLWCQGADSLLLDGEGASTWEMVVQQRHKNGVPTSLRPGSRDADYAQASSGVSEWGALQPSADEGPVQRLQADPFVLMRRRGAAGSQVVLLGFLSQQGHCAHLAARFAGEGAATQLTELRAVCELDSVLLPPGGARTSQWVWLSRDSDPAALVAAFAERVAQHHGVPQPPQPPPGVFCSWQFYGPDYAEKDFALDLAHLRQHPVPFDVFLIDECWDLSWGDWEGSDRWPSGMQAAAAQIRSAGYRPGIWTCPFLSRTGSRLASAHPEWLLRRRDGTLCTFQMDGQSFVLDPTFPGVCDHLEELFRRLTEDWGFTYHKLDFTRAVFADAEARFFDPSATRLEAYRRGLEAVRRGAGPLAYVSVCGGHYGGSLGLADSQRSGSDVAGVWDEPPALPRIKQNLLRTWMSRLWHVDPDAMMVRRRAEPVGGLTHGYLSLGRFTDDEARTIALSQYLGGGMVCLSERFAELDQDRLSLYRHVLPPLGAPAAPLNPFEPLCPSQLVSRVEPRCHALGPWGPSP